MQAMTRHILVWIGLIPLLAACATFSAPAPLQPAATLTVEPTATPEPPDSPLVESSPVTYRGETAYTGKPPIELTYDASIWRLVDDPLEPTLIHNTLDNCTLLLRDGARGAEYAGEIDLGGYRWKRASGRPTYPDIFVYSTSLGGYSAIFRVTLPPETSPTERAACRDVAEQVLSTFVTTDPTAYTGNIFDLARAVPFRVDEPSRWELTDGDGFALPIPPGWEMTRWEAVAPEYSAWSMRGVLPGSINEHFKVVGGLSLFAFDNPEQLSVADWVDQQPPSEMQFDLVERSDEAVSEYPAVYEKRIFTHTGGLFFQAWLDCGGKIWRFSTGGNEANAILDAETESIFRTIVAGFRCTAEE